MTMKKLLIAAACLAALMLSGQNLVKEGDFNNLKSLDGFAMTNGAGSALLFTEKDTWNKCARLAISKVVKTPKNTELTAACLWIPCTRQNLGFAVKPDTRYRFSLELKGSKAMRVNIATQLWDKGKGLWQGKVGSTTLGGVNVSTDWKKFDGTFKTGPKTEKAALQIQLWFDTLYGPARFAVGDHVLIDNVSVEEMKSPAVAATAETAAPVPVRKAALISDKIQENSDFTILRSPGKRSALTSFSVCGKGKNLVFSVVCREPDRIVSGKEVWDGDAVEFLFVKSGKVKHFAVGSNGKTFSSGNLPWDARCKVGEKQWTVTAEIPFSSLGWDPESGDEIAFNLGRQRLVKKEFLTWADLKQTFHEYEKFGVLVMGDYAAAFRKKYGKTVSVPDRQAYETACREQEQLLVQQKFDKMKNRPLAVAPISVVSDFAVPFLPDEVFDPADKIELSAAINERKALPVAVANLTAKTAEYRVILETAGRFNGSFGLKGFPPEKITQRFAVRFKDNDKDPGRLRLDPLPRIGEACTITVPPKEAGVVWFDFNTDDVDPGVYEGRLRVIPLSEPGKWIAEGNYHNRKYTGPMQDIPVRLTVHDVRLPKEPVLPMNFFQSAANDNMFHQMAECGMRTFGLYPWGFRFKKTGPGKLDYSAPNASRDTLVKTLQNQLAWAKENGFKPTFFIGFGAKEACRQLYGDDCWEAWILGVKKVMNDNGVPDSDYIIETYDEPADRLMPEILEFHKRAKKAVPSVRLLVTLAAWKPSVKHIQDLIPYTDGWCLWGAQYFEPPYKAVFEDAKRNGAYISHYMCSTSMRESLARYYRRCPWTAAYYRLDAAYIYWFTDAAGDVGASCWKVAPEGGICYRSFDSFIPSIRYMAIREGVTDLKYLSLVKDPAKARAYLERIYVTNAHDPKEPDRVRQEIIKEIRGK